MLYFIDSYRVSNLSLGRTAKNVFAHACSLLPAESSLNHPMLSGLSQGVLPVWHLVGHDTVRSVVK
jgi:hypothetical protein